MAYELDEYELCPRRLKLIGNTKYGTKNEYITLKENDVLDINFGKLLFIGFVGKFNKTLLVFDLETNKAIVDVVMKYSMFSDEVDVKGKLAKNGYVLYSISSFDKPASRSISYFPYSYIDNTTPVPTFYSWVDSLIVDKTGMFIATGDCQRSSHVYDLSTLKGYSTGYVSDPRKIEKVDDNTVRVYYGAYYSTLDLLTGKSESTPIKM